MSVCIYVSLCMCFSAHRSIHLWVQRVQESIPINQSVCFWKKNPKKLKSSSCAFLYDANLRLLTFNCLFLTCCNVVLVLWFPLLVDTNKAGNVPGIPKKTNSVESSQTQLEMAHPLVDGTKISFVCTNTVGDGQIVNIWRWSPQTAWNVSMSPGFVNTNAAFSWMDFPYKISSFGCHRHGWKCSEVSFKTSGLSPQTQLDIVQFPVKNKYWFWSCSGRQNPFSKHLEISRDLLHNTHTHLSP